MQLYCSKESWRLKTIKIHLLSVLSGLVLPCLFFLFSSCTSVNNSEESPEKLYLQASLFNRKGEYLKAIESYNKALAHDTLHSSTPRIVAALNEKRVLEGLTGSYYEAIRTTIRLEKYPAAILSDSLHNAVLIDKAVWLRELGSFRSAAASLEKVVSPSSQCRFELASLYGEFGEYEKAAEIYSHFSGPDRDPATRITALAGLLQCKIASPKLTIDKADTIAGRIVAESGRVFSMQGTLVPRIQAIRAASRSLQLLEKHQRNASYLLFRALHMAEESKNPLLLQTLRFESNAVIVRKADPFLEAAEYFRVKNMPYARVAALFMLAENKQVDVNVRIASLLQGFSVSRYSAPPYPGREYIKIEKKAAQRLIGLLLEKSRIFELFDATEQAGVLELQRSLQIYRQSLRLGKEHEALNREVCQLQHEISGLLQRKADIFFRAEGYEKNRAADQAINIKRGRLVELLATVRSINPVSAETMQFAPLTLQSVQGALKDDQVILKPLISDSLSAVMLIGKREFQIAGRAPCFDSLHTVDKALKAIRGSLASGKAGPMNPNAEQQWFAKLFYEPIASSLVRYRHIIVISEDLVPYHILGQAPVSVSAKRYSFLSSVTDFALFSQRSQPSTGRSQIFFYPIADIAGARIHKLFATHDRVFLLWKPYSSVELDTVRQQIAFAMQGTVSSSEALFSIGNKSEAGGEERKYITSYGAD
jgi:tetratricopeptide (TPR) repeat protein